MANIRGIKSNNEYIISATQLTAKSGALSCRLMHSCSAMDRHMQQAVFHGPTIAFLAFSCLAFPPLHSGAADSCLAFSTPATWCRIFMSRNFMSRIFSVPVSCFSKIQIGFTFLVPAHPGSPGKKAVKQVCVCVCVWWTGKNTSLSKNII